MLSLARVEVIMSEKSRLSDDRTAFEQEPAGFLGRKYEADCRVFELGDFRCV